MKKGKKPKRVLDKLQLSSSCRTGDVRILWDIAKNLDIVGTIDRICCQNSYLNGPSPGKFLTAWAINKALDPESCTQLERWIPTTDMPALTGMMPEMFTKDALLSALDFVCYHDDKTNRIVNYTAAIDDALYKDWRSKHPLNPTDKDVVAYDMTSVLFFGVTCPITEAGFNSKKLRYLQINLGLVVSKYDKYPIYHFVYEGSRNASSTVKNLVARLVIQKTKPGTIIWDRGNVSATNIALVESAGWKIVCGVPKTAKEVKGIIDETEIPFEPHTFVHKSKSDHIYALKVRDKLFESDGSVIVYVNHESRVAKINDQNLALAEISKKLEYLNKIGNEWTEAKLHKEIEAVISGWNECIHICVKRKCKNGRIDWKLRKNVIKDHLREYGKYVLFSTDKSLTTQDIVKTYFEKDFIEKVFRIIKTTERVEPVRHRLESRVRAYIFICIIAYRLLSALHFRIENAKGIDKERSWEITYELLRKLSRVERVEVKFGNDVRTLYLNKTAEINKLLKSIDMEHLLKDET